jgi:transcriptional regulator with XRE-family HTH domain
LGGLSAFQGLSGVTAALFCIFGGPMLNEALRLIRVYHDMKQSDVAAKLGVSNSYLSEIEKGRKKPTLDLVEKYSVAFKIPVSSILFFSENLDSTPTFRSARRAVASKVLNLMKFIEARSDRAHAD